MPHPETPQKTPQTPQKRPETTPNRPDHGRCVDIGYATVNVVAVPVTATLLEPGRT